LKPNHHLDYSTILAYAAGTLNEAFTVVAASHIAVCATCREAVRAAEALGGELLEGMADTAVSANCRARTLAALEQATLHRLPVPAPRTEFPAPLARLIEAGSFDDIAWKKKAPGVAMFDVKLPAMAKGQLAPDAPCRSMAMAARRSRLS
jgi:putative transcriptional regulator